MIRITCPSCGSKLNAKDELAGQTRKCPKCGQPVYIVGEAPVESPVVTTSETESDEGPGLPPLRLADRLNRESHYLICDKSSVVATWENNGQGWMVKAGGGFLSAKRNRDRLPAQGDFRLIELKFAQTPEGKRLAGLIISQLVQRWALTVLDQGDDSVVEKIAGEGVLNRDQKVAVRQALRDQFMRPVWEGATAVLEYLGSADFHSHRVGDV